MKRVLITGATGFVGTNLARRLLSAGHELHCLVRPGHSSWRIEDIRRDLILHEVFLHDSQVAAEVQKIRPEWIFHLATHGAYSWQKDWEQMVVTNIRGTANLLAACLRVGFECFVNTGSSSEYGFKNHACTETELLEPNSHYAVTKAAATLFCRQTALSEKVYIPTLRLYSVYGAYEEPGRFLPTLITRGLRGELPPLVDPNVARDFIFIDDVVDAYLAVATGSSAEPGPIYNVGSGVQTTIADVVKLAREVMKIATQPSWGTMPNYSWDANVWVSDSSKIRSQLGWEPRVSFRDGFCRMLEWIRAQAPGEYRTVA